MHANWAKASVSSGGTGTLTLAAITGFPSPYAAMASRPFSYSIVNSSGQPLESGVGHMSDASTFVRDVVLETWDGSTLNTLTPTAASIPASATLLCSPLMHTLYAAPQISDPGNGSPHYLIGANWNAAATVSIAPGANTLHMVAFELQRPVLATGVALQLRTAATTGALKEARAAVYAQDHQGRFAIPLAEGAAVSVASGLSRKDSVFPASVLLLPGWYGVAVCTDSDAAFSGSNSQGAQRVCPAWGTSGNVAAGRVSRVTRSLTYASTGSLFPSFTGVSTGWTYGTDDASGNPLCPALIVSN